MAELVSAARSNPRTRKTAIAATAGATRSNASLAAGIERYIRKNVRYVKDPFQVEWLQDPQVTLMKGSGDCDDMATLAASMLQAVGVPARFKRVAQNPATPDVYTHIFAEYQDVRGAWHRLDPSLPAGAQLGGILRSKTRDLDSPMKQLGNTSIGPGGSVNYGYSPYNGGSFGYNPTGINTGSNFYNPVTTGGRFFSSDDATGGVTAGAPTGGSGDGGFFSGITLMGLLGAIYGFADLLFGDDADDGLTLPNGQTLSPEQVQAMRREYIQRQQAGPNIPWGAVLGWGAGITAGVVALAAVKKALKKSK